MILKNLDEYLTLISLFLLIIYAFKVFVSFFTTKEHKSGYRFRKWLELTSVYYDNEDD